jgi:hypothetical protein
MELWELFAYHAAVAVDIVQRTRAAWRAMEGSANVGSRR